MKGTTNRVGASCEGPDVVHVIPELAFHSITRDRYTHYSRLINEGQIQISSIFLKIVHVRFFLDKMFLIFIKNILA